MESNFDSLPVSPDFGSVARQLWVDGDGILATFALSGAALVVLTGVMVRRRGRRLRAWRRLAVSEQGSYAVSVLMVLPSFVTLMALFMQSTILMFAKLGTVYGAYAAARSAMVWAATDAPESVIEAQVRLAAAKALGPFASADPAAETPDGRFLPESAAVEFASAYRAVADHEVADDAALEQRLRNAYGAVDVDLEFHTASAKPAGAAGSELPETYVEVTLTYQARLVVPGMGPLLGHLVPGARAPFYARAIESTCAMTLERPRVNVRRAPRTPVMGIRYDSVH